MATMRLNTPHAPVSQTLISTVMARKKVLQLSKCLVPSEVAEARTLGIALYENNEDTSDVFAARDQLLKLINAHRRAVGEFDRITDRRSCFVLPDVMVGTSGQITAMLKVMQGEIANLLQRVRVLDLALEIRFGFWAQNHPLSKVMNVDGRTVLTPSCESAK